MNSKNKTYFIFSDVHGFYFPLVKALEKAGFDAENPNHIIVSLGDLLDRGDDTIKCLEFVNSFPDDRKILIRGNHEVLLWHLLINEEITTSDYRNGTVQTLAHLAEQTEETKQKKATPFSWNFDLFDAALKNPLRKKYYDSLRDFAEIGDNIFVHSWVPVRLKGSLEQPRLPVISLDDAFKCELDPEWRTSSFSWAVWGNPFNQFASGLHVPNKRVFCGHWGTYNVNMPLPNGDKNFGIFSASGAEGSSIVGLDATTVLSRTVNVYVLKV